MVRSRDNRAVQLHSEGPFEVASFEHFGLEPQYGDMIVFSPEVPFRGRYIPFGMYLQLTLSHSKPPMIVTQGKQLI